MRNIVSDDMINLVLRQMGAVSIKTSPAYINIAKFEIGNLRLTYMYEVKEEDIYLQRISPYPMMIGNYIVGYADNYQHSQRCSFF